MKKILSICLASVGVCIACTSTRQEPLTMKEYFKDDFLIGAAIPVRHVNGTDPKADSVVTLHFNSIVAENCMKHEKIQPREGFFYWTDADRFVEYGQQRNMAIIGHALVWHSQLASWFPYDSDGKYVTPEILKQRMKTHISTLVGRYKGKIKGWDVVNEAIEDDGSYRVTPFYEILGEEYVPLAFEYAHEADPDAELYINDFSMSRPEKRNTYIKLVNYLKNRGLRIDAIGMQSHIGMDYPDMEEYEKSIVEFGKTGLNVMITELDMSALPTIHTGANIADIMALREQCNPYKDGLPEEVSERWNERMDSLMTLYKNHSDVISRVTWWGTHDGMSWRNGFPMPGRTDYPLPFDRDRNLKPFMARKLSANK